MTHLVLAHSSHELLFHAWMSRNKPVVHILTAGAHAQAGSLAYVDKLPGRRGADAYHRKIIGWVDDWSAIERNTPPLYEHYAEERVAAGHYMKVIREREHMLPLRDALLAAVGKRVCAF